MGKFNKSVASLHQMEAAAKRVDYEIHKEYYDKLAEATQRAKENARRAFLESEIARLKAELADNTETKRYVKVGSSDTHSFKSIHEANNNKGMRLRFKRRIVSYHLIPCIKCFGEIVELPEDRVGDFENVFYVKKYYNL